MSREGLPDQLHGQLQCSTGDAGELGIQEAPVGVRAGLPPSTEGLRAAVARRAGEEIAA